MRGSSPSEEEETGGPQSPENHTRQHGVKREGMFGEQDITETWLHTSERAKKEKTAPEPQAVVVLRGQS